MASNGGHRDKHLPSRVPKEETSLSSASVHKSPPDLPSVGRNPSPTEKASINNLEDLSLSCNSPLLQKNISNTMISSPEGATSLTTSPISYLNDAGISDDLTRFNGTHAHSASNIQPEAIPLSKDNVRKKDNTLAVVHHNDEAIIQMDTKRRPKSSSVGTNGDNELSWYGVCGPNAKKIVCWLAMFVFIWITFIFVLNIQKKVSSLESDLNFVTEELAAMQKKYTSLKNGAQHNKIEGVRSSVLKDFPE